MRKILILAVSLLAIGFVAEAAGLNNITINQTNEEKVQPNKTKITVNDLPQAVKDVLASDKYKGWVVSEVYKVNSDKPYYSIKLKMGQEKKKVNLDENGKEIEV
jgi:hypothetical protein